MVPTGDGAKRDALERTLNAQKEFTAIMTDLFDRSDAATRAFVDEWKESEDEAE